METLLVVQVAAEGGLPAKFSQQLQVAKVGFIGTVEAPESRHESALYHPRAADTIVRTRRGRGGEKILRY